jgi:hypothetical protein
MSWRRSRRLNRWRSGPRRARTIPNGNASRRSVACQRQSGRQTDLDRKNVHSENENPRRWAVEAHESNDQDPLRDLKARLTAIETRSKARADCVRLIEKIAKAGQAAWGHDPEFQAQMTLFPGLERVNRIADAP